MRCIYHPPPAPGVRNAGPTLDVGPTTPSTRFSTCGFLPRRGVRTDYRLADGPGGAAPEPPIAAGFHSVKIHGNLSAESDAAESDAALIARQFIDSTAGAMVAGRWFDRGRLDGMLSLGVEPGNRNATAPPLKRGAIWSDNLIGYHGDRRRRDLFERHC